MSQGQSLRIFLATLAMLTFAGAGALHAATRTWDGGTGVGDGSNWTTSANWVGDILPLAGADDLIFTGTNDSSTNNDFAVGSIFNGITFDSSAGAFTLGGNGITLGTPNSGVPSSGNITNNSASNLQTISLGITLGAGNHTIAGGTGGIALNVAGGTLKSVGTGGTSIFSGTVTSSTIGNVGSTGILGGYATVGTNWATVSGGSIVAYSGYTNVAAGGAIADNANANVKITSAGAANTLAAAGTTNINTLIYDTNTAQTINMSAGQTLRLGQFGGIFKTGTTNAITLAIGNTAGAGSLTAGGGAVDVPGEIVLNGGAGTGSGTQMQINANIVNNGTGAVSVIKSGRGYVALTGTANSYTGGTFINEGRLQASASGSLGSNVAANAVTVQSGAQAFLGNFTWNHNFNIAGTGPQNEAGAGAIRGGGTINGVVTLIGNASVVGNAAYTNRITGGYDFTIGNTGSIGIASTVTLSNPNPNNTAGGNDWTGNTIMTARTGATASAGIVRLGASQQIPNGSAAGNVLLGQSGQTASTVSFDLNGFNETINGLSLSSGATASVVSVTSGVAGSTLTLGDNNATATFGGAITGAANLALTKIGAGTQTLTGSNTYTGATSVNGGQLEIGVGGSLAAGTTTTVNTTAALLANGTVNGPVLVNGGGTLRGAGSVAGAVTVNSGGAVSGGSTLTLGGATIDMNAGSLLNLALNSSTSQPSINSTAASALRFNGGDASVTVNVSGAAVANNQYTLVNYSTGFGVGNFASLVLGAQPNRTVGNLVDNVANTSVDYFVTSVDSARWSGALSNEWSTSTLAGPKNWVQHNDGTTPTDYLEGDVVHFTDSATTTTPDISVADVSPSVVDFNHSVNYTLSGSKGITGSTGLSKAGGGTLTITNANSYSGVTALSGGTLSISASNNLGNAAGTNTISIAAATLRSTGASVDLGANRSVAIGAGGATVEVTGANALTVSGVVSGAAGNSLTKSGTGTLTLSGTNTYSGVTNVNGGAVRVTNSASVGAVASAADVNIASGAAVDLAGSTTSNGLNFGSKIFKIAGSGVGGSGALTNSGQITQNAAFNFITLTADATIGGYRMDIGRGAGINGVLDLAGRNLTIAMTNNGVSPSPQPIFSVLTPNNTTTTKIAGNGTIDVASGTLSFEVNSQALAADVTSITFKSGANLQSFRQIAGRITVPMIFEGNNIIGGGTTTGTVAQIDSPMTLKGNVNLQGLASGAVPAAPANNPIILAGDIGESGGSFGLSAVGNNTTTLAGNSSYSGTTTINSGATIQVGGVQGDAATPLAAGASGTLGSGAVVNNGSLVFNRSNAYAANNAVSGTGSVTKLGAGTLVLGGTNTYQGATTVTAGTLLVNGSHTGGAAYSVAAGATLGGSGSIGSAVTATGTLAPGASAGTLTINGNALVLGSASTLAMELVGNNTTEGGGVNDLVAVSGALGNLTLDGTLNVTEIGGGNFANITLPGATWTLINYGGTLTDNGLAVGSMPALGSGSLSFAIDTTSISGKVLLTVVAAVPEASSFLALGLAAIGTGAASFVRRRRA